MVCATNAPNADPDTPYATLNTRLPARVAKGTAIEVTASGNPAARTTSETETRPCSAAARLGYPSAIDLPRLGLSVGPVPSPLPAESSSTAWWLPNALDTKVKRAADTRAPARSSSAVALPRLASCVRKVDTKSADVAPPKPKFVTSLARDCCHERTIPAASEPRTSTRPSEASGVAQTSGRE